MARTSTNQKKRLDAMLDEVRAVIVRYGDLPERDVYQALAVEAEGWEMRLQELEESGDGVDE